MNQSTVADAHAAYLARLQRKPRPLPDYMNRPMQWAYAVVVAIVVSALVLVAAWQLVRSLPSDRSAWPAWTWPGLALLVVGAPVSLLLVGLQRTREHALARGGEIVEGIIADVSSVRGVIRYEYVVAGQTHTGVCRNERLAELSERGARIWVCHHAQNQGRSVYYDVVKRPDDPGIAERESLEQALEQNDQRIKSRLLFIFGIPAVATSAALLFIVFDPARGDSAPKRPTGGAETAKTPARQELSAVASCTCSHGDGTKTPRVRASLAIEHGAYDVYTWRLETRTEIEGQPASGSLHSLTAQMNTVPEYLGRETSGRLRMGMACDGSVVMFVSGRHATGWTDEGRIAWTVSLPEPVDAPNGGSGVECSLLPTRDGVATVTLATGKHASIAIANGSVR